jgi:integrase
MIVATLDRTPKGSREAFSLYSEIGERKYLNGVERGRVSRSGGRLRVARRLFILTLLWTGARLSECLSLTPMSFQVSSGLVSIRTLKRRRLVVREVPLPEPLLVGLEEHFAITERQSDPSLRHKQLWPFSRTTGWRIVKAVMREANVCGPRACPRGLRHSFGVGAVQSGIPVTLLQRWMGHARLSTTAIYTDVSGPEERAIAARFWQSG